MIPLLVKEIVKGLDGSASEVLFLYGRSFIFLSTLLILLKILGYKTVTIFDVVEPHRDKKSKWQYLKHPFIWDSALVFKLLLKRFSFCTYITKELQNQYPVELSSSYLLPGVINHQGREPIHEKSNNKLSIAYIGGLIEKDYPELLFEFCNVLHQSRIDWQIKIVGRFEFTKEGRYWKDKFLATFSSKNILFYNNPSDQDKNEILNGVDYVTVFRKPLELQNFTFPTRSVEVMAEGKVIITNTFGEFCKYIINTKAGIIIDDKCVKKSVEYFIEHEDDNNLKNRRDATVKLINEEFNANNHCRAILELVGNNVK